MLDRTERSLELTGQLIETRPRAADGGFLRRELGLLGLDGSTCSCFLASSSRFFALSDRLLLHLDLLVGDDALGVEDLVGLEVALRHEIGALGVRGRALLGHAAGRLIGPWRCPAGRRRPSRPVPRRSLAASGRGC